MTDKMMDQNKKEMINSNDGENLRDRRTYIPRTDIYETDDQLVLLADVPGADDHSVEITLEKNILTIRAEAELKEPHGFTPVYAEYGLGDFERKFAISNQIDRDRIEAIVKNGVLKVILPKIHEARQRKIAIKAG